MFLNADAETPAASIPSDCFGEEVLALRQVLKQSGDYGIWIVFNERLFQPWEILLHLGIETRVCDSRLESEGWVCELICSEAGENQRSYESIPVYCDSVPASDPQLMFEDQL